MSFLGRAWRLFGTGASFMFFGLGGLVVGYILIPLWALYARDAEKRIVGTRRIIGGAMRLFVWFMARVGVLRYEIEGLENARDSENYLILANHPSLIDVIFLIGCFPDSVCVVKQSMFENPFLKHVVTLAGYISNNDPAEMLNVSVQQLSKGRSLILFPEGTRTEPGQSLQFRQAAAAIAVRAGQQCLPVLIDVQPTTLTKSDRWFHIPAEQVRFKMSVQPPLLPREYLTVNDERRPDRAFNRYLLQYYETQLADFAAQPPPARNCSGYA